jgi:indole-3-glycerol phosphate synthase
MSILREIVINTKTKLEEKKKLVSLDDLKKEINELNLENPRFKQSLTEKDEAIIAEIKKASPSAGIIAEDFDPIKKAKEYEELGAVALSILTEEDYFLGSPKYLKEVRKITQLPILRKDFMIDEYQIYEAKLMGADCILLIASILNDEEISHFIDLAEKLKLDYLIEVHDKIELDRVNNRNLKTFEVDIQNSINLKQEFNGKNIFVSESGIKNSSDIEMLKSKGINVYLIGESLMRGKLL